MKEDDIFSTKIFGKKTYGDLMKEIHDRNVSKNNDIKSTMKSLTDIIEQGGQLADALAALPSYTALTKTLNENDDLLIKMIAIIQKNITKAKENKDFEIPENEREELLKLAQEYGAEKAINSGKTINVA